MERRRGGRVAVGDEPSPPGNAPWAQLQWHGAHYTLVYAVRASTPTEATDTPAVEGGYCIAPYEDNRVRLELPRVLVYHPIHNQPGRSDAALFAGDSRRLCADLHDWLGLRAERVGIDNGENDTAADQVMSEAILSDLQAREASYTCLNREDRVRGFVLSCHGFTRGVQLGFRSREARTERLLDLLASMGTDDLRFILYACSTGSPEGGRQGNGEGNPLNAHYTNHGGWWRKIMECARDYSPPQWPEDVGSTVWGDRSFADYLRDGLHARGRTRVEVYGHSDVAHAFTFPMVLRFRGGP